MGRMTREMAAISRSGSPQGRVKGLPRMAMESTLSGGENGGPQIRGTAYDSDTLVSHVLYQLSYLGT